MADQFRDDVDRLFARLEPAELPAGFRERLDARLAKIERRRRFVALAGAVAELAGVALLVVLAFGLGQELNTSGTWDFLGLMLENFEIVQEAPVEIMGALGELVPWTQLLAVLVTLVGVMVGAYLLATWALAPAPLLSEEGASS